MMFFGRWSWPSTLFLSWRSNNPSVQPEEQSIDPTNRDIQVNLLIVCRVSCAPNACASRCAVPGGAIEQARVRHPVSLPAIQTSACYARGTRKLNAQECVRQFAFRAGRQPRVHKWTPMYGPKHWRSTSGIRRGLAISPQLHSKELIQNHPPYVTRAAKSQLLPISPSSVVFPPQVFTATPTRNTRSARGRVCGREHRAALVITP